MYKVKLSNNIHKQLDKIPNDIYLRIYEKMKSLGTNPRPNGCLKLTNFEEYRVRVGDYRILYEINDETNSIVIYNVLHRKDAYRKK